MADTADTQRTGTVYRVSAPPDYFITAMTIGRWAVNGASSGTRENLVPGDTLLFHSTGKSAYAGGLASAVVGYARVGRRKHRKTEFWWIREIREQTNLWPNVVRLDELRVAADVSGAIDLGRGVHEKADVEVAKEVEALANAGIRLTDIQRDAQSRSPGVPGFPAMGSISRLDGIYPRILFSGAYDWFPCGVDPRVSVTGDDWTVRDEDLRGAEKDGGQGVRSDRGGQSPRRAARHGGRGTAPAAAGVRH